MLHIQIQVCPQTSRVFLYSSLTYSLETKALAKLYIHCSGQAGCPVSCQNSLVPVPHAVSIYNHTHSHAWLWGGEGWVDAEIRTQVLMLAQVPLPTKLSSQLAQIPLCFITSASLCTLSAPYLSPWLLSGVLPLPSAVTVIDTVPLLLLSPLQFSPHN